VLLPAGAPKIVLMIDKRPAANACAVAPDVRVLVDGVELAACSSLALVDLLSTLAVELCAPVLAVIERRLLDGPALDVVLAAEQRLVNWAQAGSAATTCELALAPDRPAFPGQRLSEPDGFAAESIAFALGTSPMAAGYALDFAWFAYRRMPIACRGDMLRQTTPYGIPRGANRTWQARGFQTSSWSGRWTPRARSMRTCGTAFASAGSPCCSSTRASSASP